MNRISKNSGFSLLEAIVAITIFSLSSGAVFAWINSQLLSLERVEDHARINRAVEQSLASLQSVNPMENPSGQQGIGTYEMSWRAQAIEDPRDNVNRYGFKGLYQVGLYRLDIEIRYQGEPLTRYQTNQVGFRQVRRPGSFDEI